MKNWSKNIFYSPGNFLLEYCPGYLNKIEDFLVFGGGATVPVDTFYPSARIFVSVANSKLILKMILKIVGSQRT